MDYPDTVPVFTQSPKRVGEILDRGFGITMHLTRVSAAAMLGFSAVTGAATATNESNQLLFQVISALTTTLFAIVVLYMAADAWKGNTTSFQAGTSRLRWHLLLRSVQAYFRILFFGMIRIPLLLFPALNYWLNQVLTPYLVLVEELSVEAAMARSTYLMTREPWYAMAGAKMRYSGIILVSTVLNVSLTMLGGIGVVLAEGVEFPWMKIAVIFSISTVSTFLIGIGTVFSQVLMVGFYNDLRARYEGADLLEADAKQ